jgi:hypothetical protein
MEDRVYENRGADLKRVREQVDKAEKEVSAKDRIETLWEYVEEVKKLQALELQVETLKKKIRLKEKRTPDLKNLKGNIEHLVGGKFYDVEIAGGHKVLPGKSYDDAFEKFRKKLDQDKKNAEKQKAASTTKKS